MSTENFISKTPLSGCLGLMEVFDLHTVAFMLACFEILPLYLDIVIVFQGEIGFNFCDAALDIVFKQDIHHHSVQPFAAIFISYPFEVEVDGVVEIQRP